MAKIIALLLIGALALFEQNARATPNDGDPCEQTLDGITPMTSAAQMLQILSDKENHTDLGLVLLKSGRWLIERRRAGHSLTNDEIQKFIPLLEKMTVEYLRSVGANMVEHTVTATNGTQSMMRVEIQPEQNSVPGRYATIFRNHFSGKSVVVEPSKSVLSLFDAYAGKDGLLIGSVNLLVDPEDALELWLHEFTHLRNSGLVGKVWAAKGNIKTLAPRARHDSYQKYQSFDELEAYERTLHVVLKRFARALQSRDTLKINDNVRASLNVVQWLLDVSGRNAWVANEILTKWRSLQTKTELNAPGQALFRVHFTNEDGDFYADMPYFYDQTQAVDLMQIPKQKFEHMLEKNLKRIKFYEKIEEIVLKMGETDDFNEIARARHAVHLMFVNRDKD